ncbi:Ribosome assembly factor mrt4, partial [Trichostrongylus colubriformis]
MPRSKRDKEVSLTKVKKKTREVKEALVKEIRHSVDKYKHLFVFTIEDMRSTHFIQVRQRFKSNSRFFFGKNNVMAIALGKDASSEYAPELHKVSQRLQGQCGLMFTLLSKAKVSSILKELSTPDFARAGHIPRETITVPEGPVPQFAFSMEPQLRKLGLPTKLDKGLT